MRSFASTLSVCTVFLAATLASCGDDNQAGTSTTTTTSSSSSGAGGSGGSGGGTGGPLLDGDCDPLVPSHCGYPFPSNVYLLDDAATVTGKHVEFGPTTIVAKSGSYVPPDVFRLSDGFSASAAPMTHMPGATVAGLATPDDIDRSLLPDSPTVLIEAETGTRIPHFAELDMSNSDDANRALMIRPVVHLKDSTRYIVAIRNVKDAANTSLPPSEVFQALRDDLPHADVSVERRRALYADIFAKLETASVMRTDLQIAWDFSTASRENNTAAIVAMRDHALAQVGADGPAYTIDNVVNDFSAHIARRIEGTMTVPLYLDKPSSGASLNLGPDGLPAQNGTATYPFLVHIPYSATTGTPGALLQYGHGLLGGRDEIEAGNVQEMANEKNFVVFAVDWIGMAADDQLGIVGVISSGNFAEFKHTPDRLQQGFVNALLAMRMMSGKFAEDSNVMFNNVSAIDPTQRYYDGNSQGGIFGACYMAISTDVTRGVLGVPGQPYGLLLNRSKDFNPFFSFLQSAQPNALDQQLSLGVMQMLWDRAEPGGYSHHISSNMLPGTPKHDVLLHVAMGDHQVSTLGAHIMARTVGAKNIAPVNRTIFQIEEVMAPYTGSAMVEWFFGNAPDPITNTPPFDGEDPHGKVRKLPSAKSQKDVFLRTGTVENFCVGPCDPE
jgi:hypothetical protein